MVQDVNQLNQNSRFYQQQYKKLQVKIKNENRFLQQSHKQLQIFYNINKIILIWIQTKGKITKSIQKFNSLIKKRLRQQILQKIEQEMESSGNNQLRELKLPSKQLSFHSQMPSLNRQDHRDDNNEPLITTKKQININHNQSTFLDNILKAIQTKITYMKNKQQKTVKKVLNIKRKLTSLQNVRSKTKQIRDKYLEEKKKSQEQQVKKTQFNQLIKDHLKYNKKIVMTLMNHKVNEQAKSFRQKNSKLQILTHIQEENLVEQNIQKANKVRIQQIEAHQRRKMYFLDKLHQFKQLKQQKLRQEMRQRQRQQQMIYELQQKQKMLLQRLSVSQKFRIKCQEEYEQARKKYRSFYQASKGINRGHRSCNQSRITQQNQQKANIFIS